HQDLPPVRVGERSEGGQRLCHPLDLHPGEDDGERLAGAGPGEAIDVEPLVLGLTAGAGPAPPQPPDPAGDRLEPQPRLVLGPHLDRLARVGGPQPPHPAAQVFFHARRRGGSADLGWLGRGTWRENPSSHSHRHPVSGRTLTCQRSATYRATFGPLHSPPSAGRLCNAAYRASRRRAESFGSAPLSVRRSISPSGP